MAASSSTTLVALCSSLTTQCKISKPEAPVSEANPEPAATQVVEVAKEEPPKREEIFAVVMVGSRQYIVIPGRWLYVQRLKGADVNDKVTLNKVLLVGTRTSAYIGKPVVTNASVHAVVEEQGLDAKKIVFKYKKKKNYRRNIGHRQLRCEKKKLPWRSKFCWRTVWLNVLLKYRMFGSIW
ncbi:50S RIBOSOMAL PROTEIN L21 CHLOROPLASTIC [Salix koriyanagi]|uniref:50S RIBOSOMAL PROTEIN L21 CHLOROPLASTIC n=1 Tax=Salix koriyanagi TaxID=2511006 RepID=A0A9Q0W059_9ROSI|nr:50S RIBOSOMAL PROTEIN L21 CHLOROPLASTIC [Salix koriyanagi]